MGKLSATAVKAATRPGRLGDGDGLFLMIQPSGGKSWVCRVQKNGTRRDFGLGSVSKVSLATAGSGYGKSAPGSSLDWTRYLNGAKRGNSHFSAGVRQGYCCQQQDMAERKA